MPDVLGTRMQSVGEAMAIGRTFPESLQKGLRSLEHGRWGLNCDPGEVALDEVGDDELVARASVATPTARSSWRRPCAGGPVAMKRSTTARTLADHRNLIKRAKAAQHDDLHLAPPTGSTGPHTLHSAVVAYNLAMFTRLKPT